MFREGAGRTLRRTGNFFEQKVAKAAKFSDFAWAARVLRPAESTVPRCHSFPPLKEKLRTLLTLLPSVPKPFFACFRQARPCIHKPLVKELIRVRALAALGSCSALIGHRKNFFAPAPDPGALQILSLG